MAVTKIHRINSTLNLAIDYITNGGKTEEGHLVSSFACAPEIAYRQFERTRKDAYTDGKALAHHLIQSFLPGEVDAEKAHEIGKQLAQQFLDDKYQYVLATHVDKGHIHNHIIFNSVSFVTNRYYESYKKTYYNIRNLSDELCKENGLYVIPPSPNRGQNYYEYTQAKQGKSYKAKLKETIDNLIPFCKDYEDLISKLEERGYEIKRGKYISVRASDQERFTRIKTLGEGYTEESLVRRIQSKSRPFPFKKEDRNKGKIIDIAGSEKIQNSPGLKRWATLHNLKEASAEYNLMQKHGFKSIEDLDSAIDGLQTSFDDKRETILRIEDRMRDLSVLMDYSKTIRELRPIYEEYRKAKNKEEYHRHHESDILIYETTVKQIKAMGYTKVPSFKTLKSEYDSLVAEHKKMSAEYKKEKTQISEYASLKKNLETFLSKDRQVTRQNKRDGAVALSD